MNKIAAFLNQPAPLNRKPWLVVMAAALIVFFLLFLLVNTSDSGMRWKVIIGFSLVTTVVTAVWIYGFPLLFKTFYSARRWVVWKMLINNVIIILLITVGNVLYHLYLFNLPIESFFSVFTSYLTMTLLIGLLPATVSTLIVWNVELKRNLEESRNLNIRLKSTNQERTETPSNQLNKNITFIGSTRETVEMDSDDFLYMEASGNYLLVNYLKEGKAKQKQIRSTVSQQEKTLTDYPNIIRCHRGFMINTSHIIHLDGNAQGLQLTLAHVSIPIPVSRNYIASIRNILSD